MPLSDYSLKEARNALSGKSFKLTFKKKHSPMQNQATTDTAHKEHPSGEEEQPQTNGSTKRAVGEEGQPQSDTKKELCVARCDCSAITPPSSARRRWMLLSSKVITLAKTAKEQPQEREDADGFKSFGFFALAAFGERSPTGTWYQLISPTIDIHLELHFLAAGGTTKLEDLVGYDNTGNVRLWPSEECLAKYVLLNEEICNGKRILELGAGMTGLAGLMALTVGAKEVFLTDGNEKSVSNLNLIVERNSLNLGVKCALLEWAGERLTEKFDVVLCADCLFFTHSHRALLGCIHAHLIDGGIAYLMAPSRRGSALQFLNQFFEERQRWKDIQVVFHFQREIERQIEEFEKQDIYEPEHLLAAIHFACMQISDEVADEVEAESGTKMQFEGCVIAQVAHLVTDALCSTWPDDLLLFAKHGKRSIVNTNDVKLLVRKNESLVKFVDEQLTKLSSTRRQKSSSRPRSEAIPTVQEDSNGPKTLNEKSVSGRRGRPSKAKTNANLDANVSKITDFLVNDSEPIAGPSRICEKVSLNEKEDGRPGGLVMDDVCLPIGATHGQGITSVDSSSDIREPSPVSGSIVFDDLANPFPIEGNSDSSRMSGNVVQGQAEVLGNGKRRGRRPRVEEYENEKRQCVKKPAAKRKAKGNFALPSKRRASKQGAMVPTSNAMEADTEDVEDCEFLGIMEEGDRSIEMVFSSVVRRPTKETKATTVRTENSELNSLVGEGTSEDGVSTIAQQQKLYRDDRNEIPKGRKEKTTENIKSAVIQTNVERVNLSTNNCPAVLRCPKEGALSPERNEHLRQDLLLSGGSSRDLFATPSPVLYTSKASKGSHVDDNANKSAINVINSSSAHPPGPRRNITEILQSQREEHSKTTCKRVITASKDGLDFDDSDIEFDFDGIDAMESNVNEVAAVVENESTNKPNENKQSKEMTKNQKRKSHFSDFIFESDEDEIIETNMANSVNVKRISRKFDEANAKEQESNSRRGEAIVRLPECSKQFHIATTPKAIKDRQEELKIRLAKEFSIFNFESDEEGKEDEENAHSIPTIDKTINQRNIIGAHDIGEKTTTETTILERQTSPSTPTNKVSTALSSDHKDNAEPTDEMYDSFDDDFDLDATIFD